MYDKLIELMKKFNACTNDAEAYQIDEKIIKLGEKLNVDDYIIDYDGYKGFTVDQEIILFKE